MNLPLSLLHYKRERLEDLLVYVDRVPEPLYSIQHMM